MSSIEKLSIRGIRSFSPNKAAVIEFGSPLTIIVGHNGAGKTTITECLRYAVTGDLPPNSKGGAFVNDPRSNLTGSGGSGRMHDAWNNEVKAQIRLKFRSVRGAPMIVTRSLQCTLKKSTSANGGVTWKIEQKTLEGLLATIDPVTGEQVSVSTRCAELDAEVPAHLGVSRAILDNVLFCHQEDACWPLSEPAALKKRFDDIFAAAKYTRALEALKSLRKDLATDLKGEQAKLEYLRADLDRAARLEVQINDDQSRLDELHVVISETEAHLQQSTRELAACQQTLTAHDALLGELDRLQHDLNVNEESLGNLRKSTRPIPGAPTEESLRALLHSQASLVQLGQSGLDRLKEEREEANKHVQLLLQESQRVSTELAVLSVERETVKRRLGERSGCMRQLSHLLNLEIPNSEDHLLETDVKVFAKRLAALDAAYTHSQSQHNATLSERARREKELADEIAKCQQRIAACEDSRRFRQGLLSENRSALMQVMDALERLPSSSDGDDSAIACETAEAHVAECERLLKESTWPQEQSRLQAQINMTQAQITQAQKRLQASAVEAAERARAEVKRVERDKRLTTIAEALRDIINALNSEQPTGDNDSSADLIPQIGSNDQAELRSACDKLDTLSKQLYDGNVQQLNTCEQALMTARRDLQEVQWKHDHFATQSNQIKADLERLRGESRAFPFKESDNLEHLLAQSKHATDSVVKKTYKDFLEKTHACPVCERPCDAKLEASLSAKFSSLTLDANDDPALIERAIHVRSEVNTLTAKEQSVKEELTLLGDELHVLEGILDDATCALTEVKLKERHVLAVRRKVEETGRMLRDLPPAPMTSSQSQSQPFSQPEDLSVLTDNLKTFNQKLKASTDAYNSIQSQLRQAQEASWAAREHAMQCQLAQAERTRLSAKQQDLQDTCTKLKNDFNQLDMQLKELNTKLEQLKQALSTFQSEAARDNTRDAGRQGDIERAFVALKAHHTELSRAPSLHEMTVNEHRLKNTLQEILEQVKYYQESVEKLQATMAEAEKNTLAVQLRERSIHDNLRVCQLVHRSHDLKERISSLIQKCDNGVTSRAAAMEALQRAQVKHADLMGKRASLGGQVHALAQSLTRARAELEGSYGQAPARFQGQNLRVRSLQLAGEDLERYGKALDGAILRFHSHQMDRLNRLIRDIWTSTYQGSDIDTIAIRAEAEQHPGPTTSVGSNTAVSARSYAYRVVMVRGQTEMELRGRSSAGQRVLASLVIRMALADAFGHHCGILALDEPTTNLDAANIRALAVSLASIMEARRRQANLQLILITHDEEFVQLVRDACEANNTSIGNNNTSIASTTNGVVKGGMSGTVDHYWRVFRAEGDGSDNNNNAEGVNGGGAGSSCIERQSLR